MQLYPSYTVESIDEQLTDEQMILLLKARAGEGKNKKETIEAKLSRRFKQKVNVRNVMTIDEAVEKGLTGF